MYVAISATLIKFPLATAISFNEIAKTSLVFREMASSMYLFSILALPSKYQGKAFIASDSSISLINPTRPILIPKIGIL